MIALVAALVATLALAALLLSLYRMDARSAARSRAFMRWAESLERVHDAQREAWGRAFAPPPAHVEPAQVHAPPDPDVVALARFSEATLDRAMRGLRELSAVYGTPMSDEEARKEAEALLHRGAGPFSPL